MRLLKRDQCTVAFRNRVPMRDDDGTTYEGWCSNHITVCGNIQPAGGKVMAEQYGERLGYVLVMYTNDKQPIVEGSGAWVYASIDAEEPDYKVVAVRRWRHTVIELEKVR